MALVFGDSFDHYPIADIFRKWTAQYGATAGWMDVVSPLPGHNQCLLSAAAGNGYQKALPATQETFVCGFWFRTPALTAAPIIAFYDGSTEHVSVRHDASGHITFTRNATVLATSTNMLIINTWYHIETKVTIGDAGDTPSGRYEVRVNGTATNWIPDSGTGQDTRNGGNKSISVVGIVNGAGQRAQDFYVLNTTGAVASDFLGPCRFTVLRPIGAGNSAQFTGNYADNFSNVADQTDDGDTTFNQDSTAGHIDSFVFGHVPSGTVFGIQHNLTARQDAGPSRTIRPKTRISGTPYAGTTVALAANYIDVVEAVTLSPATGIAWTTAEINAAEFGYELVS